MKFLLCLLFLPFFSVSRADPQSDAIAKYPALAVEGSPLNSAFVERCVRLRDRNPSGLRDPQWAMKLANACAEDLDRERAAILAEAQRTPAQKQADAYIAQLTKAAVFPGPIVTTVEPKGEFFPAEGYHQDYLRKHPGGYSCHFMRD